MLKSKLNNVSPDIWIKQKLILWFLGILVISQYSCSLSDKDLVEMPSISLIKNENEIELKVTIAKWYDNHRAAISLTIDHGQADQEKYFNVQELILKYGLTMDYELVTYDILQDEHLINYIHKKMIPKGFGFFGHGHKHYNFDTLSYAQAYESFKQCYNSMMELGIKPVAYAYPGGFGYHYETRRALKDAGFLCGRRFEKLDIFNDPYILADTVTEPPDWYSLPTLVMQSFDFQGQYIAVNNTKELTPLLESALNKTAWIIATYHDIGHRDEWGYYELSEFETDLMAIKSRDFWCTNMSKATLYAYERKAAKVKAYMSLDESGGVESIKISLSDGLANDYFDQPLTLRFEIPDNWLNKDLILSDGVTENVITFNSKSVKLSLVPKEIFYTIKLKQILPAR